MPRLVSKLVAGLAALAVFAGTADADSFKVFRKRRGFFETLFGGRSNSEPQLYINSNGEIVTFRKPKRRPAFDVYGNIIDYKDKRNSRNALNVIYGYEPSRKAKRISPKAVVAKKAIATTEYAEPEPLPGLGMGTVEYQSPLVKPVFDVSFAKLQTDNPASEAIRLVLADKSTVVRAVEIEREAVLAFYSANGFKPLWTKDGHATERALAVLKVLSNAEAEGLVASNYLPPALDGFDNVDQSLNGDNLKLAAFDIGLTAKTLKYARELSGGQFDPARLSLYNDIKTSPVAAGGALQVLAFTPFVENYLASLAPNQPQYAVFKDALSKISGEGQTLDQIAEGPRVKAGKTDSRIPAIRARLQVLGFISAEDAVNSNEELLDKALSQSLKKFQLANRIKQTGNLDTATVIAFNTDHSADERQRLIYNMERLRWLPKSMGTRYVFVNQPAFQVDVMDGGKSVWNSRVIVGRPLTQTYAFYDSIETVVFKPSWTVPASIIVNEYGPKSRKDPGYLDRQGYKLIDMRTNKPIDSSRSIDWYKMGQSPYFTVQQPPGDDNALGDLKFLFPNAHSIYMHDTPNRGLFSDSDRAFSHGCVRVQNPREFASVLLGWDATKVDENVDRPDSHSVNLTQKVPVYLTYFTAWPNADGKIMYYNDIYGRDDAMAKALGYNPTAKPTAPSDKIVQTGDVVGGLNQN
jgi:L,D-transpeptidase YcbB